MSLKNAAMLVKMTIKQWDPYARDDRATESVDVAFNTNGKSGNFNKKLLDRKILLPITTVLSEIRAEHNRMTMPWTYKGVSILPSSLFLEYTGKMRSLEPQLIDAVNNLGSQMPVHLANQRSVLGSLFNPDDYPSAEELTKAYGITHSFFPVPSTNHFVLDLEENEVLKIKQDLENNLKIASKEALSHLYSRVAKVVGAVHERLSDPENVFRACTFDNVRDLVEILPRLNVFEDENLNQICRDIKNNLLSVNPQVFRENLDVRKEVAQNAFDIIKLLNGPQNERLQHES